MISILHLKGIFQTLTELLDILSKAASLISKTQLFIIYYFSVVGFLKFAFMDTVILVCLFIFALSPNISTIKISKRKHIVRYLIPSYHFKSSLLIRFNFKVSCVSVFFRHTYLLNSATALHYSLY